MKLYRFADVAAVLRLKYSSFDALLAALECRAQAMQQRLAKKQQRDGQRHYDLRSSAREVPGPSDTGEEGGHQNALRGSSSHDAEEGHVETMFADDMVQNCNVPMPVRDRIKEVVAPFFRNETKFRVVRQKRLFAVLLRLCMAFTK